jgi:hypothetical protein
MMHCAGLTWNGEPAEFGAERNPAVLVSFDDDDWATFLAALYGAFGDAPFTVRAIAEALRRRSPSPQGPVIDAALLPGDLPEKWARVDASPDAEGGFRKSLGQALKHRTGRYAARWRLVEADRDPHDKVARYAVQPPLSAHP